MCGRFTQQMFTWEELYNLYNLSNPHALNLRPRKDANPEEMAGSWIKCFGRLDGIRLSCGIVTRIAAPPRPPHF
jgi:hypothetical protein